MAHLFWYPETGELVGVVEKNTSHLVSEGLETLWVYTLGTAGLFAFGVYKELLQFNNKKTSKFKMGKRSE